MWRGFPKFYSFTEDGQHQHVAKKRTLLLRKGYDGHEFDSWQLVGQLKLLSNRTNEVIG